MGLDAHGGDLQRSQHFGGNGVYRRIDLVRRYGHTGYSKIQAVELLCIFGQRSVPAQANIVDDCLDHGIDVFGYFPLGRQKGCERGFETGSQIVETDGQ